MMSSETLICFTEPSVFHAQDNKIPCVPLSDSETLQHKVSEKEKTYCSIEIDNQKQDPILKGTTQKQLISRKREASNVLMECVKRRDNFRTFEFNVPLSKSNQDSPLRTVECNSFSLDCKKDCGIESVFNATESCGSDLSDSASLTDSGIDTSSKASSPSHSIDTSSSQEDASEECPSTNMDVDADKPSLILSQEVPVIPTSQNPGHSPGAIYEDLNGLHLTDEAVLSENNSVLKSPISKSLFSNVASTIYFALKDERVAPMPPNVSPFMKWKLSTITPILIKELVQRSGFILLDVDTTEEWLGTWGKHLKCKLFKKIKHYQKVNHYPGSFHLGRKDKLWDNFKRVQARFGLEAYSFFPETYHLPNDLCLLKSAWKTDEDKCWIIKPPSSARGKGVKVVYKWTQIPKKRAAIVQRHCKAQNRLPRVVQHFWSTADFSRATLSAIFGSFSHWSVALAPPNARTYISTSSENPSYVLTQHRLQSYISDPYLINGTKFDLRIYVLVSSFEPLRIYVFEDGLVRFASEKYSLSNKSFSNRFVHLTNYSINRRSSSYTSNEDENACQGHKWTLKSFWTYMSNSGIDIETIQKSITDIILKTVICTEGPISRLMKTYAKSTYNCYELFGFDIMLDKNLQPWLLEVNISPSLHTRSLLDYTVKGQMVKDMLNMVGFQVPEKKSSYSSSPPDFGILSPVGMKHKATRNRSLSPREKEKHSVYTFQNEQKADILDDLTPDDVRCLVESEDEYNRKGSFTRIFPTETSSEYFKYFEHIRYYNLLLDAWEKKYCSEREEGISLLQELCNKQVHLQTYVKEASHSVKDSDIEITVH